MSQGNNNNELHPTGSRTTAGFRLRVAIAAPGDTTTGPRFDATPQAGSTIRSVVTSWAGCSGAPEV